MFIVNKDRSSIINTEQITAIFIGADNCSIKAEYKNGNGCQLGRYNSESAARTAMDIISEKIGFCETCFMPKDNEIDAKINIGTQKQYHINGKKTKGHGGS